MNRLDWRVREREVVLAQGLAKMTRVWANPAATAGPGLRRFAHSSDGRFRGQVFAVAVWLFGSVGYTTTASARPCTEAIFDCGRNGDVTIKNAKALFSEGRTAAWIRSRCRPEVVEPPGCDWGNRVSPGGSAGSSTVLAKAGPSYTDAAPGPLPTPVEPPPNRDNARRGPTPAPKDPLDVGMFADEIAAAAQRYKLPPQLIRAVMMTESGGNPLVLSNKGAVGLMQLLPATAREMGVDDIHDVAQNLMGGARFLRVLANRFEGDLVKVLSAYHAGSTRVLGRDATPFAATDDYVRKILRLYYQLRDAR